MKSLGELKSEIQDLAERAGQALPKVVAQPDLALLQRLFNDVWKNVSVELNKLVEEYRSLRDKPHEGFCRERDAILNHLENSQPPGLPDIAQIEKDMAAQGAIMWYGNEMHRLRVSLSQAFEALDSLLDTEFERLREKTVTAFLSPNGGRLNLKSGSTREALTDLSKRWESHEDAEKVQHAIARLLEARLSFREFIQPRIRATLDVLDEKAEAAKAFAFTPADTTEKLREKLVLAWEDACYKCRNLLNDLAGEPSMALFATIQDFADDIIRNGGADAAQQRWFLFYSSERNTAWPDQFGQLEADTALRREWENAVTSLKTAANSLSTTFQA